MASAEPILVLLLFGAVATLTAALGSLPLRMGVVPRQSTIGISYSLAGGCMLGAAYLLMSSGLDLQVLGATGGAVAGILYTRWVQGYAGLYRIPDRPGETLEQEPMFRTILAHALHSSSEGVAIGAAAVLRLELGIFMALALAIHNVGEAMGLSDALRRRGTGAREAAGVAIATNVPQPILAVATYAIATAAPISVPSVAGFAAGALVMLVLTESVPSAYHRSRETLVALTVSATAAGVVLAADLLL